MNFFHFIKSVLGIMPFLALCFANAKINLNKANRSRQFLMPIISFVYCILGVVFLNVVNNWILNLFNWLCKYFTFLQNISWQPIGTYVLNAIFVLGFIIVKSISLPIISNVWKSNKISEYTSGIFYEREEDVDKWLLKLNFANFRGYVKGFYVAAFISSVIVFLLSVNFPKSIFFQAAFYPVFGVLVLGEIVFFLSGLTKSEFVEDILGEDEDSYKVANYGILREILRDLFADHILYESTLDTSDGISETFDELDETLQSEDPTLKLIGSYYMNLKNSGTEIDINYVKSSISLMNGKSTLFCNPFYRDLTHYVTLPMIKQLIGYKKCLIVLGRDSALSDVKQWIDSSLEGFSNTDSLWQSRVLDEYGNVSDVGIIKFSDIHNLKIHKANKEFLSKVGFVFLVEPSRILASGQIGLGLLVNNCETPDKEIVYCACDRNCDGLVDALSHTLKTSITEVTATVSGGGNNSQTYWNADGKYMHHKIFPNVSRYLGMGTEINAVAMKYQIDQTGWVGSEKFPVHDMKWIAGQYYKQICQYADLPESQAFFNRSFNVYSNLWSAERKENSFLVVEDEFQNLFEITRVFASRAKNQGFVNVISENYFLRDYMLDNVEIFSADPKAIPTIVLDFARTERNMVLKLIMMMAYDLVSEERISKELMLCGIAFENPYTTLKELIIKHCNVEDASLSVRFKEELQSDSLNSIVVKYYEINETNELYEYAQSLKNAYYIAEDEEGESHYIGAKLYGHVFQAMLPGQFMTFEGKYYEVQTVTPLNGVVVRRAADHITGRNYYKQIRKFVFNKWIDATEMGSKREFSDIEIIRGFADISVETEGYLNMDSYGNLAKARKVLINGVPTRNYRNKSILKIRMPKNCTNRIRYTICLLMNEIFRTTYPETYHYIAALTSFSEDCFSENLKYATYRLEGESDDNCIYIVEDSDIDLGLIVSVERNLKRYFEIISDVLDWHSKKMLETLPVPENDDDEFVPDFGDKPPQKRKGLRGIFDKVKNFFKKIFGKNKKEVPQPERDASSSEKISVASENVGESNGVSKIESENGVENSDINAIDSVEEISKSQEKPKNTFGRKIGNLFRKVFKSKKKSEEIVSDEDTVNDIEENDVVTETELPPCMPEEIDEDASDVITVENADETEETLSLKEVATKPELQSNFEENVETDDIGGENEELAEETPVNQTDYQKNCFLKFGFETIDAVLDLNGTSELLKELGFDKNPLSQVREISNGSDEKNSDYDPHKYGSHLCDFCGVELLGGEYEVLKDGRERCNRC